MTHNQAQTLEVILKSQLQIEKVKLKLFKHRLSLLPMGDVYLATKVDSTEDVIKEIERQIVELEKIDWNKIFAENK